MALLAEIIGTVGGFGSSVFFVPIANFYFPFQAVLGLTALFHLSSNLSKIVLFRKGFDKKLLLWLGAPSVLFVIAGGWMSRFFNSRFLELGLGIFLAGISLFFLLKPKFTLKPEKRTAMAGGAVSGFVAGMLGTGGAVRGLTMAAFNLEKQVFIATSAFIDFFVDFSRTIVYYLNGYIKSPLLLYLPFLVAIGFAGTYIGKRILRHIAQENFRKISLALILLIGLVTLVKALVTYWKS